MSEVLFYKCTGCYYVFRKEEWIYVYEEND